MSDSKSTSRRLFFATIGALLLGVLAGTLLGKNAEPLGEVSKLVVQALKAIAIPLLFLAIVDGLLKARLSGRGFGIMAGVSSFNALVSVVIALVLVNVFKPGLLLHGIITANSHTTAGTLKEVSWIKALESVVPESIIEPFASGSTPGVIVIALLFGFGLRQVLRLPQEQDTLPENLVQKTFTTLFAVCIKIIGWLIYLVPIAVFCAVAKAVGRSGLSLIVGLSAYVMTCIAGMTIQILMTYQLWIAGHPRLTLRTFWRAARAPAIYAFGINSSLATMPMTLTALRECGVKDEAARLSTCIGTNFNNDGILLYEVVAALIIAQALGIDMSLGTQLWVALLSVVATLGVSGFPEAGIVALTLVLSSLHLPGEALVTLLSVDWVIARCRSTTNVLADMTVATAIDRFTPDPVAQNP
ncbi:MAG: dicarboxylate/amino acid:cation symporter [Verrucomicrobiota bacterium]